MPSIRISTVQTDLLWEDKAGNLARLEEKLLPLSGKTDLVILPEMFTTGFSMNAEALAEGEDGPSVAWMARMAQSLDAAVTGSLILEEQGRCYNRLIWMRPDGRFSRYDKRHLFSLADEQKHYSGGSQRLLVEWRGWTFCPLICYDLRFPVWSRNNGSIDMLIYVANFPEKRRLAWKSLLLARAIENQCFVAGVNRVGTDGTGIAYTGDTCLIDYEGEMLHHTSREENVHTLTVRKESMQAFRANFPFLKDADEFQIRS